MIAQMEGFCALNAMQKNLSSLQSTVYEKNQENLAKMVKMVKIDVFANCSCFFLQEWYFAESGGFLRCIQCIKPFI